MKLLLREAYCMVMNLKHILCAAVVNALCSEDKV